MKVLVTGSAGHLGEAICRTLAASGHDSIGIDLKASPYTNCEGNIADRSLVADCMPGVDAIIHTATLHKPHVGTHSRQDFIDTNVTGTLNLLEEAVQLGNVPLIFTSTTSTFGNAMKPGPGEPAVWVTEALTAKPKNIYGVTKLSAEALCELFHQNAGLPCLVLRTSRFFPEEDDDAEKRNSFSDDNLKVTELLYRRADIADMVSAHLKGLEKIDAIGFDRFIISATTPFNRSDAEALGADAATVIRTYFPDITAEFSRRKWSLPDSIGRVYDNSKARSVLGWEPAFNFDNVLARLVRGKDYRSDLAIQVGARGYHDTVFEDGPYPVNRF